MRNIRQWVLSGLALSLFFLQYASAAPADLNRCTALLERPSKVSVFVQEFRRRRIGHVESGAKNEEYGYLIEGSLGQSTSSVFLAKAPFGAAVVIKRSTMRPAIALSSLWRELSVTEYLLENGEKVPRILMVKIDSSGKVFIAKEYFEGLTGAEIERERTSYSDSLPKELSETAWSLLEPERDRLKNLFSNGFQEHPSFRVWYGVNLPRLIKKYGEAWAQIQRLILVDSEIQSKLNNFIYAQDFGIQNFLFDVPSGRWIAFDP
ncbi:MAG: hypothetical protein H7301_13170 [Cryobacterium sp.]|nr:hypothetical protein [Oligoflexia bacterium]